MGRPPDPERRNRTLAQVADYLLEHGLEEPGDTEDRLGLSLGHLGLNGQR